MINPPLTFVRLLLEPLGQSNRKQCRLSCVSHEKLEEKTCQKVSVHSVLLSTNCGTMLGCNGKLEMAELTFLCHALVSNNHIFTPGHLLLHLKIPCYIGSLSALVSHSRMFISCYATALQESYKTIEGTFKKNICYKCGK